MVKDIPEKKTAESQAAHLAELLIHMKNYGASMFAHLHEEETVGHPIMRRYITEQEWRPIEAEIVKRVLSKPQIALMEFFFMAPVSCCGSMLGTLTVDITGPFSLK